MQGLSSCLQGPLACAAPETHERAQSGLLRGHPAAHLLALLLLRAVALLQCCFDLSVQLLEPDALSLGGGKVSAVERERVAELVHLRAGHMRAACSECQHVRGCCRTRLRSEAASPHNDDALAHTGSDAHLVGEVVPLCRELPHVVPHAGQVSLCEVMPLLQLAHLKPVAKKRVPCVNTTTQPGGERLWLQTGPSTAWPPSVRQPPPRT